MTTPSYRTALSVFSVVSVLSVLSCAKPQSMATVSARSGISSPDADTRVSEVLEAVFTGDAKGVSNDSLYNPTGAVVANGSQRFSSPRLAGVQLGGESAITSTSVNVRDGIAWGSVEYRWFSSDMSQVRVGRATVVLTPRPKGGWWVDQLHSSTSR